MGEFFSTQPLAIGKGERAAQKHQKPCVIWFTGLSGAGKSTIANIVDQKHFAKSCHTMLLDGDNVRHGLNRNLGFTEADRVENIRRVGEVAKLMADAGLIVICSFISPYTAERDMVRNLFPEGEFIEVFVDTPIEECARRDPKGLYSKAKAEAPSAPNSLADGRADGGATRGRGGQRADRTEYCRQIGIQIEGCSMTENPVVPYLNDTFVQIRNVLVALKHPRGSWCARWIDGERHPSSAEGSVAKCALKLVKPGTLCSLSSGLRVM